MYPNNIRAFAYAEMEKWQLLSKGWRYKENRRAKTRYGRCYYDSREIEFCVEGSRGQTIEHHKDTILHEIAHALCFEFREDAEKRGLSFRGHGTFWKEWAETVGAKPERTGNVLRNGHRPNVNYIVKCPDCGLQALPISRLTKKRRARRFHCNRCKSSRTLRWTKVN